MGAMDGSVAWRAALIQASSVAVLSVLAGAGLAGLPSLATVLVGAHWLGVPLAVALFALWWGRLAAGPRTPVSAAG
jgi:hypothetical protein